MKAKPGRIGLRILLFVIAAALFFMAGPMQVQAGCTGTPIYFVILESNAPIVSLEGPQNASYDTNGIVNFRYNVTDESNISRCSLVLNGTVIANQTSITRDATQYFRETGVDEGTWNWYVNCTDRFGNTGQSETWTVTVDYPENVTNETLIINETIENAVGETINATIELIDAGSGEVDVRVQSGEASEISAGIYDINITPIGTAVDELVIYNYSVITDLLDIIDLDNFTDGAYDFVNAFAIYPRITGYGYIDVSTTAVTGDTLVCEDWNFGARTCTDFRWRKIGNYDTGQNYTLQLYNGTAGFVESNYTINLIDISDYMILNDQSVIKEVGSIIDALLIPENHSVLNITVRSHNKLNKSNDLKVHDIENETGWRYNMLVDPDGLNFVNASLTKIAEGTSLWKCHNYNYTDEICEDDLIFVRNITPDEAYTLVVNATDPVFFEQPDDIAGVDSFIFQQTGNSNYGSNSQLRVNDQENRNSRSLVLWNISHVPPYVSIDSAVMELYLASSAGADIAIDVVRINESWSESGVTWNTQPDYDTTVHDSVTVSTPLQFYAWNITDLVRTWYNGTYSNYGVYLKASTEDAGKPSHLKRFWSSDYTVDPLLRPKITINYSYLSTVNVTLEAPNATYTVVSDTPVNVTFNCSATSTINTTAINLTNISLYMTDSDNTNFSIKDSSNVTGGYNTSSFVVELSQGTYTWNCKAYDISTNSDWGDENRTVSIIPPYVPPAPPAPSRGVGVMPAPPICIEDWVCGPWEPCFNGKHTRNCTDLNECGTEKVKPVTEQTCYYICTPEWSCTGWSECTPVGKRYRNCTDMNACQILKGKPSQIDECGYDFCHDGIQNNGEEGIDCGGECEPCKVIEKPRLVEFAEANILCMLLPILEIALLIMIMLIRASKLRKRYTRRFAIINVVIMIAVLLTYIPFSVFSRGICMAIADSMAIMTEILVFFSVLFAILLTESIIYLIVKHLNRIKPISRKKRPPEKKKRKKEVPRTLLIIFLVLLAATLMAGPAIFYKYIAPASDISTEGAEVQLASPMPVIIFYVRFALVLFGIFAVVMLALRWVIRPYTKELEQESESVKEKKKDQEVKPRK